MEISQPCQEVFVQLRKWGYINNPLKLRTNNTLAPIPSSFLYSLPTTSFFLHNFMVFVLLADQVYGDQEMHSIVRKHCMDYMVKYTKNPCSIGFFAIVNLAVSDVLELLSTNLKTPHHWLWFTISSLFQNLAPLLFYHPSSSPCSNLITTTPLFPITTFPFDPSQCPHLTYSPYPYHSSAHHHVPTCPHHHVPTCPHHHVPIIMSPPVPIIIPLHHFPPQPPAQGYTPHKPNSR